MNHHVKPEVGKFVEIDLSGTFIRRVDLRATNLEGADFSGADCTGADFRGANFKDTILNGTVLKQADLSGATNLSMEQLASAIIDATTILPDYLK
jgi:uncharacterized protein YjbI with pentapeptide repeats